MKKPSVSSRFMMTNLLIVVAATIFIAATMIIFNNSFRSLPLFFFLFVIGLSLMVAFGMIRGGAGALVVISAWIGLKRYIGVWQAELLLPNAFEMALVLATFAICGIYSERLRALLDAYFNSAARLELLNLEDTRIGLVKSAVGKLRLQEEEERSVRYRRPFSLLLIQVQPKTRRDEAPDMQALLMRTVANTVKSTTRKTDIPFLAASDQIALILPETDIQGANRVVSHVTNRMQEVHFLDNAVDETSLQDHSRLCYGTATFTGNSSTKINMLEAAEHSLEHILATDTHKDFQEIPLMWEQVGDLPINGLHPIPNPIKANSVHGPHRKMGAK